MDRNRRVDSADFSILATNFGLSGRTYGQGDLTGNGTVDGADFSILATNFGASLPVPQRVLGEEIPPVPAEGFIPARRRRGR